LKGSFAHADTQTAGTRVPKEAHMSEFPKLPRKPLGYDPAAVDRLISERDSMLGLAEHRIRQAEARLAELEGQLRARDQMMAELQADLETRETLAGQMEVEEEPQGPAEEEPPPLSPKFMTDELSKIVVAAEESTSQIIERAWTATRDQIVEADRLWREVQTESVRFATWRREAEAFVESVKSSIEDARAKIEEVPQRVQEALAPAVEAMVEVDSGMARFAVASSLPLLGAPTGLQAARAGGSHAPFIESDETGEDQSDESPGSLSPEEAGAPDGLWVDESYLGADRDLEEAPASAPADLAEATDAEGSGAEDASDDDSIDPSAANIWRGSA
jgi:hypothetical protein